ncbi:MAG: hypothetical protein ACYDG2_24670 [Ruminiclostridium sp.]
MTIAKATFYTEQLNGKLEIGDSGYYEFKLQKLKDFEVAAQYPSDEDLEI